jgi:hypothetical protein
MEVIICQAKHGRNLLDAKTEAVTLNAKVDGAIISIAA